MTDVFLSSVTGQEVFAFYAPVKREKTVEGGIAGIMIVDQMVDMVTTNGFNSGSYSYVLKSDGTVIMQTSHADSLYSGRDYFSFLRSDTDLGVEAVSELQKKMERKEKASSCLRPRMRSGSYTMRRPRSMTGTCSPWFPIRFPTGTASTSERQPYILR